MCKLILLHPTGAVTQTDLENILTLDASICRMQTMRDEIAAGVLHRVTAGTRIEDGPRTVDLERTYSGKGAAWPRLPEVDYFFLPVRTTAFFLPLVAFGAALVLGAAVLLVAFIE
ncbi:MAG: hypothetical protein ABI995_02720 [Acidobacteriota bacterium]